MASYHHVQYQKKTNDPILKKFTDGGMDADERLGGRTDTQTDRRTRVIS